MKNKPISHKNENIFRYLSFNERLNQVNIDVIHQIGKTSQNPEDAQSFFQEAVEKWSDLNYTEDYDALKRDIGYEISTLLQIIHKREHLINVLLKHMENPDSMAMDAALELVVALARDLQFDFYSYFPKFFLVLTKHLKSKDPELLERIFICVSYLFKFLWRYMVNDMHNVYRLYSSLLTSDNKDHITSFAAESFAFLIRKHLTKAQDKPKFFHFLFSHHSNLEDVTEGLGKLFFEVMRGVRRQFHSCTKMTLLLLLKCLGTGCEGSTTHLPYTLVEQTLLSTLEAMQKFSSKGQTNVVEEAFSDVIDELTANVGKEEMEKEIVCEHLYKVLHIVLSWVQHQDAWLLSENTLVFQIMQKLSTEKSLTDDCIQRVGDITVILLKSKNIEVPITLVNSLLNYIYVSAPKNIIFAFTKQMVGYGMFQKDILPRLLQFCATILCNEVNGRSEILSTLTETVTCLSTPILIWEDVKAFNKLPLYTPKNSFNGPSIENLLIDILEKTEFTKEKFSDIWCCLICLPHFKFADTTHVLQAIEHCIVGCVANVNTCLDECCESYLFILHSAFISWLCLDGKLSDSEQFTLKFFVDLLVKFPQDVSVLHVLNVFISSLERAVIAADTELFETTVSLLIQNLVSPFHQVRLLSLRMLCSLPFTLPVIDNEVESHSVFHLCLKAEEVSANIEEYREKLKWIRKLECSSIKKHLPVEFPELVFKAPLNYLLGSLYINFSLLWDPILDLISSFAHGELERFWKVFMPHLCKIMDLAEKDCLIDDITCDAVKSDAAFFLEKQLSFCQHPEKPDVINHRLLLWKAMVKFPHVVRQKDMHVVPLLFHFMEKEVVKVEETLATTEAVADANANELSMLDSAEDKTTEFDDSEVVDIENVKDEDDSDVPRKKLKLSADLDGTAQNSENCSIEDGNVANAMEDSTDVIRKFEHTPRSSQDKRKKTRGGEIKKHHNVLKTLSSILTVFSKLKKPLTLHRSVELRQLYYELLSHNHGEIQRLAFDCIVTFNFDFLMPYKDNFCRILDDKTFKTEIVLFGIGKDNEVIQENHRTDALSILMRILYGKMLRKTGNNTSGKTQAHMRKSLVLRFLCGCHAKELMIFFNLVFEPLKGHLEGDIFSTVKSIRENIDLANVVPIRKLRSMLSTLEVILDKVGSLVPDLIPWFLKVILVIATTVSSLLDKREELLPHCVTLIKLIRKQAIMTLIHFFKSKSFMHYNYAPNEIDAIFEAIVWPSLPKLEYEALIQPPPLLRLFDVWCQNPRYFPLLAKHHPLCKSLSPLPHIMSLYTSVKARPRVVGLISTMVHSLLTKDNNDPVEDSEMKEEKLNINDCLIDVIDADANSTIINFGMRLLLPHVGSILKCVQFIVLKASKSQKRTLESRELTILLQISSYIEDCDKCKQLIGLLVPFFTHQKKLNGDCEVKVLATINNLISRVDCPVPFVKLFAPLFGILSGQRSRAVLVEIFATISSKEPALLQTAEIVKKINACNPRFVEEPDYESRLDGHKAILSAVADSIENVQSDFVQIVIFNSAFVIKTTDDICLRDSASNLLQDLTKKFSSIMDDNPVLFRIVVFDTLLPEIRKGIQIKKESFRSEFIRILSALLRNCGAHVKLQPLASLCDEDFDFFETVIHLQIHQRARTLLEFSSRLNDGKLEISSNFLMAYMIPIVSSFFFDNAYAKHVHVIDAAVETVGAIAKQLNWLNYESVLRYYLNLLSKDAEHHKTIVKIIAAILNSFHFDLSASRGIKVGFNSSKAVESEPTVATEDKNFDEITAADDKGDEKTMETIPKVSGEPLNENKATKIHITIAKSILPQLQRSLMHKKSEDEHKLAGPNHPGDDEVLRVPIALAIAKLLQILPHDGLKKNIAGLFLKMCQLLKSRTESIRASARDTLVKIMEFLGPEHFNHLLQEMNGVMKKGYQVHVMTFTVSAILQKLKTQFKSGDLDSSASDLVQICLNELFGETAEEKEVAKITGKLKEARSNKSYMICEVLSEFVSENCLMTVVGPLKEKLDSSRSHKSVKKLQECLRHVAMGFNENSGISMKIQLIFIHDLISTNLLLMNPKSEPSSQKESKYIRPDIYLIPKEPPRGGPSVKTSKKTNAHIVVDFALQLFYLCLKRDKLKPDENEHLEMMDPFIPILSNCLDCNNVKVISTTFRCLLWLFKCPLPTLQTQSKHVVASSFVLLNKYAGPGMGQGDNFEMVVMCFKMLTTIVRDTNYYKLNENQLRVLLNYIDQDIHDHTRQATAFNLLKAIVSKKLEAPELSGIMKKIAEMSITSEQDHIRTQCRQVSILYLVHYPLGKNLHASLSFYINQLEYLHEYGRMSAIKMIHSLLESFPPVIIKKYSGLFFIPLAARLVNDQSSTCKEKVAELLKKLLEKLDHEGRITLFSVIETWMESKQRSHRRLAIQICGFFTEIDGESFIQFLHVVLPFIINQLKETSSIETETQTDLRCQDHFLFHIVNGFHKILSNCVGVIRNDKFQKEFNDIWELVEALLLYEHIWVRNIASQCFQMLFSCYEVEEVLTQIQSELSSVYFASRKKMKDLSDIILKQLQNPFLNETVGNQIIDNLVYLSAIISNLPESESSDTTTTTNDKDQNGIADIRTKVTLSYIIRRLCREVSKEVDSSPQITIKRMCVFKFLENISRSIEKDHLYDCLFDIFKPLCREQLDSSLNNDKVLKSRTSEILRIYKKVLGSEDYEKIYTTVQNYLINKKVMRKRERVKEAVTNPEKFAKRKIKKQINKKEAKKRKILMRKGKQKSKKQKLSHLAIES